jgi:hypothetical protein
MTTNRRLIALLGSVGAWVVISALSVGSQQSTNAPTYDCGTIALFMLLRIEGQDIDIDDVKDRLPEPDGRGFSMQELRSAAGAFGVPLDGMNLRPCEKPLDRPALVFIKRGPHGHFSVVRPVGHTGKLVQVLDSTLEPKVLDVTTLCGSSEWTGMALLPRRPNWAVRIAAPLLLIAALTSAAYTAVDLLRNRSGRSAERPLHFAIRLRGFCIRR